jgi:hypothetical protein
VAGDRFGDLVGGLGPDERPRVLVAGLDPGAVSALSWRTDRCAPRLSLLAVGSANQRSTRFSHDALVGVKCTTKRGWAAGQRWTAGVLCVEELSSTRWMSSAAGTALSIVVTNFLNSIARWAYVRPITWPEAISSAA